MMHPENGITTVMQLNMGDGKTLVNVPMLCASLADGKNLVQITVLKSLFKMNLAALTNKLTTYLDRKVFVFPFKRRFKFNEK
jgi:hypothetical protein